MYNPYPQIFAQSFAILSNARHLAGIEPYLQAFFQEQTLDNATAMLDFYFSRHQQGDIRLLRTITTLFADKRVVLNLVNAILADSSQLVAIAARSYPHPIGFDKLVLYQHPERAYKLRLHLYWRSPQEVQQERVHLHRFEMASSPITGELTNHLWQITETTPAGLMTCQPSDQPAETMYAYTGYERDAEGRLHKRYMGTVQTHQKSSQTFVPGQTYAQNLSYAHYVETNAETGHTNGDFCSTIYIHGPSLADAEGRTVPVLLEPSRLPDDDTIITPIPAIKVEDLRQSLESYAVFLSESLRFYAWLYDPKYGKNLSVGMIAGYLLNEVFASAKTIETWNSHPQACLDVLNVRSQRLKQLVGGELKLKALNELNRETRYFQQLLNKSWQHTKGREHWLQAYGDLGREFARYIGALVGDYAKNQQIDVLKPIWQLKGQKLRRGAHYGHIAAMLEAVKDVQHCLLTAFRSNAIEVTEHGRGPVSQLDGQAQDLLFASLSEHFPGYGLLGEEGEEANNSDWRWLIDSIDGTRNFVNGHLNFAISIACQQRQNGQWVTTDAVLALPARGEVYWAEKGQGAWYIDADGDEHRLQLSSQKQGAGVVVDLSIKGLGSQAGALYQWCLGQGYVPRGSGCASLMLAMLAGHGNHAAVITANPYDVAAGLLIAQEAGVHCHHFSFGRDGREFLTWVAAQHPEVVNIIAAQVKKLV